MGSSRNPVGLAGPGYQQLRILEEVASGERWIFSAGFNVDPELQSTERIDEELSDLRHLSSRGARTAILSHQGDWSDGTAGHLNHVAAYLSDMLRIPVEYFPESIGALAERRARQIAPGEIVLFGNTRFHQGEQTGNPLLARGFAQLGDKVAIGGFSKAHRNHASNVGLMRLLPFVLSRSMIAAVEYLGPWARHEPDQPSVAIVGGNKPEKTVLGLARLVETYDWVIPAGVVLHHCLVALGIPIGDSELGPDPRSSVAAAQTTLTGPFAHRVLLPDYVVTSVLDSAAGQSRKALAATGITGPEQIVDFVPSEEAKSVLIGAARILIAGTPSRVDLGFTGATHELLQACRTGRACTLLMGGDTTHDLPSFGSSSTGGGSSLEYLTTGRLTVLDVAMRLEKPRFRREYRRKFSFSYT